MSKNEGDQRAKFDPKFESEDFDAEACLRVPDLNSIALPYPDVEAYRHLAHALPLLPKAEQDAYSPEALKGGTVRKSDEQKAHDVAKRAFIIKRTADYQAAVAQAGEKNPIQILANRVRKGPLMLLKQVYDKTQQIDIVLRHTHGIRGLMRATLFGFDKYFNMLLGDIQEVFVVRQLVTRVTKPAAAALSPQPVEGEGDTAEADAAGQERTRTAWKQILKYRKLSRLILKGDQVVVVYLAVGKMRLPGGLGVRFQDECDRWTGQ